MKAFSSLGFSFSCQSQPFSYDKNLSWFLFNVSFRGYNAFSLPRSSQCGRGLCDYGLKDKDKDKNSKITYVKMRQDKSRLDYSR